MTHIPVVNYSYGPCLVGFGGMGGVEHLFYSPSSALSSKIASDKTTQLAGCRSRAFHSKEGKKGTPYFAMMASVVPLTRKRLVGEKQG